MADVLPASSVNIPAEIVAIGLLAGVDQVLHLGQQLVQARPFLRIYFKWRRNVPLRDCHDCIIDAAFREIGDIPLVILVQHLRSQQLIFETKRTGRCGRHASSVADASGFWVHFLCCEALADCGFAHLLDYRCVYAAQI